MERREAPLIVSFPHTGTEIPPEIEARCVSPWLARKDADWWIDQLYDFVRELGATIVHTAISRTVIDVNRDPSGVSLYPGQNTTELVPTTTFDGEPLWRAGQVPDAAEIARRADAAYFEPYHAALAAEIARLRAPASPRRPLRLPLDPLDHPAPVPGRAAGDEHRHQRRDVAATWTSPSRSPRSPRQAASRPSSTAASRAATSRAATARPSSGVHAVQMELACRGYMREPVGPVDEGNWPVPLRCRLRRRDPRHAARDPGNLPALCRRGQREAPMTRIDNARSIRAPRGTEISAKSWLTEAPLRMLMNNLDPEVAEKPGELVVYGGIGRAARDWESFDRIVAALRKLEADETLLVQSGKPVGVFRTHADAPRVLIANSNLVPHWATLEHFNELDRKGLMMYGQMTAGSWIYIGSQGIVQGTYETFVEMGRRHYGGSLAGNGFSPRASAAWAARSRWRR